MSGRTPTMTDGDLSESIRVHAGAIHQQPVTGGALDVTVAMSGRTTATGNG